MTDRVTVVARFKAKSGSEEHVGLALKGLLAPTRAEQGCINYDLHRSLDDPSVFVFHENWTSRAMLDRHLQSPHIQDCQRELEGHIDAFVLDILDEIGPA